MSNVICTKKKKTITTIHILYLVDGSCSSSHLCGPNLYNGSECAATGLIHHYKLHYNSLYNNMCSQKEEKQNRRAGNKRELEIKKI